MLGVQADDLEQLAHALPALAARRRCRGSRAARRRCAPTVSRELRLAYGSWNTICMSPPKRAQLARPDAVVSSVPSKRTEPAVGR